MGSIRSLPSILSHIDRGSDRDGNWVAFDASGASLGYVRVRNRRVVFAHARKSAPQDLVHATNNRGTLTEEAIVALVAAADADEDLAPPWANKQGIVTDTATHFQLTLKNLSEIAESVATLRFVERAEHDPLRWSITTAALLLAHTAHHLPPVVHHARSLSATIGEDALWWAFCESEPTSLCHTTLSETMTATDYMVANRAALALTQKATPYLHLLGGIWWQDPTSNVLISMEGTLCAVIETTNRVSLKGILDRLRRTGATTLRPHAVEPPRETLSRIAHDFKLPGNPKPPSESE